MYYLYLNTLTPHRSACISDLTSLWVTVGKCEVKYGNKMPSDVSNSVLSRFLHKSKKEMAFGWHEVLRFDSYSSVSGNVLPEIEKHSLHYQFKSSSIDILVVVVMCILFSTQRAI